MATIPKISHHSRTKIRTATSFWQNAQLALFIILPAILFFSFHPVIVLGNLSTMNLELSLPLIWLVLFNLCSLPSFITYLKEIHLSIRNVIYIIILCIFPLYLTCSCLWSPNHLRGLLAVGIFWLICGAIAGTVLLLYHTLRNKSMVFPDFLHYPALHPLNTFIRVIIVSALIVSLFCWLQCILDIIGIDRNITLLCAGCTYQAFGFPHPSGFAIEPQFMGGLLLAPILLALFIWQTRPSKRIGLCAFFLSATLFLTFSRGAIYAFVIAIIIIAGETLISHSKYSLKRLIILPLAAFCFTLCAQGIFAWLSPTTDTFISGITKSIHHLSLGLVDLRPTTVQEFLEPVENYAFISTSPTTISSWSPRLASRHISEQSVFDGYANISTDTRMRLTQDALMIWQSSRATMLFGTGLGSAGTVLYEHFPELGSPKEIVQNQYVSLLLETGILGYLTLIISLVMLFRLTRSWLHNWASISSLTRQIRLYWWALIVAYLVTICFFAGLPNALYIYLLAPICLILIRQQKDVNP